MFSFLPLINNSVTLRLHLRITFRFLFLSISAIISSRTTNISVVSFNVLINIIHIIRVSNKSLRIIFEYSIKALESLKCFVPTSLHFLIKNWYFTWYGSFVYKYLLSISGWWFIKLNNDFFFQIQSLQLLIFCMDD